MTPIELCSSALIKLGADSIDSFDDGSPEARVAEMLYPLVRDAMLSRHPWSFAVRQTPLAYAAPCNDDGELEYRYELPRDYLKALSATMKHGRAIVFRIHRRELWAATATATLTYIFRPPEADFPDYFNAALVSRLAAEFCLPLTENSSRAGRLARLAWSELKVAKLVDSQQERG